MFSVDLGQPGPFCPFSKILFAVQAEVSMDGVPHLLLMKTEGVWGGTSSDLSSIMQLLFM